MDLEGYLHVVDSSSSILGIVISTVIMFAHDFTCQSYQSPSVNFSQVIVKCSFCAQPCGTAAWLGKNL